MEKTIIFNNWAVHLPMPVYPVIEDVGWWRGEDGSTYGEPYRNGFPRRHVLADYQALGHLAQKLGIRLLLGMVLGEWDRTNLLRSLVGATWQGANWNNSANVTGELMAVSRYLLENEAMFEFAVHGLCHEFWRDGRMERTEFHDPDLVMRTPELVRQHLEAYMDILHQNLPQAQPRVFIPPALYHSFGKGDESMQAILAEFDIHYVITRFSRARQYQPLQYRNLGWECGVGLLERGISPVAWQEHGCAANWNFEEPILPLHWGNLLHPDPEQSIAIVDDWIELLRLGCSQPQRILARSLAHCWRQVAAWSLGCLRRSGDEAILDLSRLPVSLPHMEGEVVLKFEQLAHPGKCFFYQYRQHGSDWCDGPVLSFDNTICTAAIPVTADAAKIFLRGVVR